METEKPKVDFDPAALGPIKCKGGWRNPAYPKEPPFSTEEVRRYEEIAAKLPKPKR